MSAEPEEAERGEGEAGQARLRGPWWFRSRRELTEEQRRDLFAQLYFEGAERRPFLGRFAILMALSIFLACFGLAQDSAAVVIGAMLVSPLTTPLLGFCASLVLAWPRRQLESVAIIAAASVLGIGLAWLIMSAIPEPQAVTISSSELIARTNPRVLDLAIAIVAGGAGAYVLVRREAIGALPGVAIAVALVPPLASVGMMLQLGEPGSAAGALLLYVTNLAGIVLAGSLVLIMTGVQPRRIEGRLPRRTKIGVALALLVTLALVYPLQVATRGNVAEAVDRDDAQSIAEDWIEGTELELLAVAVTDDETVDVDVAGPKPPPSLEPLARDLAREFDQDVTVTVGWTKQKVLEAGGSP